MLELWTSGKVAVVLTDVCYGYIPLGCNKLFHPALHLKILYMLHTKLISHKTLIFNHPEHWQSTVY